MLLSGSHLKPGSSIASIFDSMLGAYYQDTLKNSISFQGNWLESQGWTKPALEFGLIIPTDYGNGNFYPDKAMPRFEMAVMSDRILGLVYPAASADTGTLTYKDAAQIPAWAKGYVKAATDAGVFRGLPDGSFGGDLTATRAEAVTAVSRILNYMENGIDKEIKVYVKDYYKGTIQPVALTVPAQMIGGRVYVPVLDLYNAALQLYYGPNNYERAGWDLVNQVLGFEYGVYHGFHAGDLRYEFHIPGVGPYSPVFPAAPRLLYGYMMVPVYNPGQPAVGNLWFNQNWDAAAKTLTVCISEPSHPIS